MTAAVAQTARAGSREPSILGFRELAKETARALRALTGVDAVGAGQGAASRDAPLASVAAAAAVVRVVAEVDADGRSAARARARRGAGRAARLAGTSSADLTSGIG